MIAHQPLASILFFYDGPNPPAVFDDILVVPTLTADIGTRSFLSLVEASPGDLTKGYRYVQCTFFSTIEKAR